MTDLDLQDAIIRRAIELQRLAAGAQSDVDAIMTKLAGELKTLLESRPMSEASKRAVADLVKAAEAIINPAYADAGKVVDTRALALIVAEKTVDAMGELFDVNLLLPTEETLASLTRDVLIEGSRASAWWGKQAEDTAFKFAAQVRQGVINGETNERIVQRIVGRRGEPGIMDVARRHARSLVASSVNAAANDARLATYRKNSKHIRGVKWLATLDSHTCKICAALDGVHWDLEGGKIDGNKIDFRSPPAHVACRCVLSPVPKKIGFGLDEKFDEISERASSLGPIKGDTSFAGYFGRLTAAQQNAQFGEARAKMMRAGKITVRDLISGTGRELTIDELRAL